MSLPLQQRLPGTRKQSSSTEIDAPYNPQIVPAIKANKIAITHIINGLYTGGAEMMLYKLLSCLDREKYDAQVITLLDGGELRDKIESFGITTYSLGMQRKGANVAGIKRLLQHLRQTPPDLIQSWMYHSNLFGSLTRIAVKAPLVWNIRCSKAAETFAGRRTIWAAKAGAALSHLIPARIVCGSVAAWNDHLEMGYEKEKMVVIQNGFDLDRFRPDPTARQAVRKELQLSPDSTLVGIFTRFDPFKDPENFVRAAAFLHTRMPGVHFVMCGHEISLGNQKLVGWLEQAGIQANCHLLGTRQDVPQLMAAMDIIVSSSQSEGFPNVLGEAMACGVPCAATDAGDSALIIGDTGKIAPIKAPEVLAQACEALLRLSADERRTLGLAARQRIEDQFSLTTIAQQYEQLYQELLALRKGRH